MRNAAEFRAIVGGLCGILFEPLREDRATCSLFFSVNASEETRFQFEEYVHQHLLRRAAPGTLERRRLFVCGGCNTEVTQQQVRGRKSRPSCTVLHSSDGKVLTVDGLLDRSSADRTRTVPLAADRLLDDHCQACRKGRVEACERQNSLSCPGCDSVVSPLAVGPRTTPGRDRAGQIDRADRPRRGRSSRS